MANPSPRRLMLDALERRDTPATFIVTDFGDAGEGDGNTGDLRYCIGRANELAGADVILFRGDAENGVYIPLRGALPAITDELVMRPETAGVYVTITREIEYAGSGGEIPPPPPPFVGEGETPPPPSVPSAPPEPSPGEPPIDPPIDPPIEPPPVEDYDTGPKFRIFEVADGTTVRFSDLSIFGGRVEDGNGGNVLNRGNLTIVDSYISGGYADNDGGNIANEGTLTIVGTHVSYGAATDSGGGIANDGTLTVRGSFIEGNSAKGSGGAVRNRGEFTGENTTFVSNTANGSGGAIRTQNGSTALTNVTIAFNIAEADGGGIRADGDVVLRNTLIAANQRGFDPESRDDVRGTVAGSFNLIGVGVGTGLVNGQGGNLVGDATDFVDAKVVWTIGYDAPGVPVVGFLAGSPARDAGDPAGGPGDFDARGDGFPRVFGGRIDIGAFESDGTDPEDLIYPLSPPASPPPGGIADNQPPLFAGEANSDGVYAVGGDEGSQPFVTVYDADGTELFRFLAYEESFTGGVRVAVGDVTGDGVPDIVTAPGVGGSPVVKVFDGTDGTPLSSFFAFEESFTGGVFVVTADVNRDGFADIVVSPDVRGGPRCKVVDGDTEATIADFFAIDDAKFRGGIRVAARDLNGDTMPDLLVGAGVGGGPRVAGFDGTTLDSLTPEKLFADFFAFEERLRDGVYVSAGDVDDDAFGDLIFGAGPGGGPRVLVVSGKDLIQSNGADVTPLANFFVGDELSRGGVRVAAKDLDDDGQFDLLCGTGIGDQSNVSTYLATDLFDSNGAPPEPSRQFEPTFAEGDTASGVFVG